MSVLTIAEKTFWLTAFTRANTKAERLDSEAAALFAVFLEREAEFGFHPSVVVDYPNLAELKPTPFLADASRYAAQLASSLPDGPLGVRTVVLTTYADIVKENLKAGGYACIPIDMPAGPEHTAAFILGASAGVVESRTLYIEAVNEADEKIKPSFVLKLTDESGVLWGGACGSLHAHGGKHYAYLSTMTLAPGMPTGSGTALVNAVLKFLRDEGVSTVHLGTQTAAQFYEKLGFTVEHRLVRNLRVREQHGRAIFGDLVMLSREL